MNRKTFILILAAVIAAPLLDGCSEHPAAPYGWMYEGQILWDDPRYDFIASINYQCSGTVPRWTPDFNPRILGVSPDGRQLLLPASDGLRLYDYRAKTGTMILPGKIIEAAWSRDGRYVVASRGFVFEMERFAVWDYFAGTAWTIRLPNDFADVDGSIRWLPGDTTILIRATLDGDSLERLYEVDVRPPFRFKSYFGADFQAQASGKWYRFGPSSGRPLGTGAPCYLLVEGFDGTKEFPHYLYDVFGTANPLISPDGNWMATEVKMSTYGSRFRSSRLLFVDGLAIIDLRPESFNRYKLVGFFPDHTHFDRNCVGRGGYVDGAWDADSRHILFERFRESDGTIQFARLDIMTGDEEIVSDFK